MTFTQKSLGDMLREIGPYTEEVRDNRIQALLVKTNPKSRAFSESVRDNLINHAEQFVLDAEKTDYISSRIADITIAFGIAMWDVVMNLHERNTELPFVHRLYRGTQGYVLRVEAHPSQCVDPTLIFLQSPTIKTIAFCTRWPGTLTIRVHSK